MASTVAPHSGAAGDWKHPHPNGEPPWLIP
jgi:hypothetical protein